LSVILENKFHAALTPDQPSTCLKRLAANGVLVFLAPPTRAASLVIELAEGAGLQTPELTPAGASDVATVHGEPTLVIPSWDEVLIRVASALK
jgi:hypothetical protein